MNVSDRVLSSELIGALKYWPGIVGAGSPPQAGLTCLLPFINGLLSQLPWWNREWQVITVEPAYPHEVEGAESLGGSGVHSGCTEVSVRGTMGVAGADGLPFVMQLRFTGDRLLRFQVKAGDTVIAPAVKPVGKPEPHPFGAIVTKLMDLRGVSSRDMARRCFRSESTIRALQAGHHNPHPLLVKHVAEALDISPADLAAIAGTDDIST